MGTDKASIRVPSGRMLIEEILARLRQLADDLVVVANDDRFAHLAARTVPDVVAGSGPLGGIAAALAAAQNEWCLVVACDMPFLSAALLRALLTFTDDVEAVVPRLHGRPEPLHACYHRQCLPAIQSRLQARDFKIISFFPDVRVRYVEEPVLRLYDPDLRSFENVNTPDEWERAIERRRGDGGGCQRIRGAD